MLFFSFSFSGIPVSFSFCHLEIKDRLLGFLLYQASIELLCSYKSGYKKVRISSRFVEFFFGRAMNLAIFVGSKGETYRAALGH